MTSIERFESILRGIFPDRIPFVPSIYEHGAAVLRKRPADVSHDPELMANAALESYALYNHDLVTVGIDVYTVEVEAFGCDISSPKDFSIPGVVNHPLSRERLLDPESLQVPKTNGTNRLALIAEASKKVYSEIGDHVWVYGCMSGPFSQAVELRSFEKLLMDVEQSPNLVHELMEKTTELSINQAKSISQQGCGVYVSESFATIPLISPKIFKHFVVPYHKKIIASIRGEFSTPPPAVIMGGNTAILIDFFIEAGSAFAVADFNTDFEFVKSKTERKDIIIRGCVDPKIIERGDWEQLERAVVTLVKKARGMINFVWGCGCVSYNTPGEHLLRFKKMCLGNRI